MESTYLQIIHRFEKEKKKGTFPTEFHQNEMKWAAQLMKSKKLQRVMADYTEKVAQILENEMQGNTEIVKDWVSYPHSNSLSPQRDQMMLEELRSPIWYPERPSKVPHVQTAFNQTKQHLRKLAVKNQKRKEEQLEKIIKEQEDAGKKDKLKENVLARIAT